MQQLVELQHQVKEKRVDGVLPGPTIKTESTEANQPVMLNQQTPEHLSRSTGTQPTYQENTVAKSNTNTFWCF